MRRGLVRPLVALAAAALVAATFPVPASAAQLDPATESARMLRKSDTSPVLGLGKPLRKSVVAIESSAPPLCNQVNQNLVHGPRAESNAAVSLVRGQKSGLLQVVYDYGSHSSAVAAFTRLARRAKDCNQRNALPSAGKNHVQILTSGSAPVAYKGVPGVWTREVNGRSGGAVDFDNYSLNLLVGETVQQFSLAFFDAGRTTDVQRSALDSLALTLAKRWQS